MKKWIQSDIRKIVIALVIVVAIAGVSVSAWAKSEKAVIVEVTQGAVDAKEVSLNTKIPGRIVEFYVAEGDDVKKGDPIVKISSGELEAKKLQLQAQIDQATAGVEASKAVVTMAEANYQLSLNRVEQAEAGLSASRSQRDMASAVNDKASNGARTQQIAQAESAFNLWEATYNRALALYEGGAISTQKIEEIKTQMDVAAETLSMAREGARTEDKAAAAAQLQMASSGIDASQALVNQAIEASNVAMAQVVQANAGLAASEGLLAQAEAGLMEVEVYLEDTLLLAPIDGTVTGLNSDEGELVSTGTSIGTLTDLNDCWITLNLDEDKLAELVEGQEVGVRFLAYEGTTYVGTVTTINAQPDFAIKKATNDNGNFDIVSFGVKIKLDNQGTSIHPGMTAVVDFDI